MVEGATPPFWTLVRHRPVLTGARSGARLTLASGGRSLHSDPCGKAVSPARIAGGRNYIPQQSKIMTSSLGESLN